MFRSPTYRITPDWLFALLNLESLAPTLHP